MPATPHVVSATVALTVYSGDADRLIHLANWLQVRHELGIPDVDDLGAALQIILVHQLTNDSALHEALALDGSTYTFDVGSIVLQTAKENP